MRPLVLGLVVVACGSATPTPTSTPAHDTTNVATAPGAVHVEPGEIIGTIAFAPLEPGASSPLGYPISPEPAVMEREEHAQVGLERLAVPSRGASVRVVSGVGDWVPVGCADGFMPFMTPWRGPVRLAPGVVWLVPLPLPPGWDPRPVAVEEAPPEGDKRRYRIASIELIRIWDGEDGELTIRDGNQTYTLFAAWAASRSARTS